MQNISKTVTIWLLLSIAFCFRPTINRAAEISSPQAEMNNKALKKCVELGSPDIVKIQLLLVSHDFKALEKMFEEMLQQYKADAQYELFLELGYQAFDQNNDISLTDLDLWVKTSGSYVAYAARGGYKAKAGFAARGAKFISETSRDQIEKMQQLHAEAVRDLQSAITKKPSLTPAYSWLVSIAKNSSQFSAKQILQKALENDNRTFVVRQRYMESLQPRWGGSYKEMAAFANEAAKLASVNPLLWSLQGEADADRAGDYYRERNYEAALASLTAALKFGDRLPWLKFRALCYEQLGQTGKAEADREKMRSYGPTGRTATARFPQDNSRPAVELNKSRTTGPDGPSDESKKSQITVAVLDLDMPNYLAPQQASLSNRFRSELINTGKFLVVERNKMNQLLEEQKLSLTGLVDGKSAVKIGKMLGVRQIISGSLAKVGNIFTISVRAIDAEMGKVVTTADMDCECSIEDVLVITLNAVSRKLAGLSTDASGYVSRKKLFPPLFTFEEVARYTLPFKADQYADLTWGDGRLYIGTYDGNIYRLNTELGLKVEGVYPVKKSQVSGLGWDGIHLWSTRLGDGQIIKFSKTEAGQAVDFIFNIPGADTHPYAMAINGDELYTVGYSKKLKHYKILGPTEIKKVDEKEIGAYHALAIVDGRIFVAGGNSFAEIAGGAVRVLSPRMPTEPCVGMTYDGQYFWVLTEASLYKYRVNQKEQAFQQKDIRQPDMKPLSTSTMIIRNEYSYTPQKPVAVVWDGRSLWSLSNVGESAGIHQHDINRQLGVVNDFRARQIRASLLYGFGSLAWDGKSFISIGSSFDGMKQQTAVVRLQPVSANASRNSQPELSVIEISAVPLTNITALAWADGYLWLATGQNTKTSGEGSFIHKMRQDQNGAWEIVKTFKYIGSRCQGLAWDGTSLWSYDVFKKRFYKHNPGTLDVLAEFSGKGNADLEYFSGLAWDGKRFWTGNYRTDKIYQIEFAKP